MKIDISKLIDGSKNKIDFEFLLPVEDAPEGTVFPKPAEVRGEIVDYNDLMILKIRMSIDYETECARCLKPVSGTFNVDFGRTVTMPGTLINVDPEEYVVAENNMVDVDIPLYEQILLDFPSRILCKDDCKGLCPRCGKDLNEGECNCQKKETDPRLAVLSKLLEDD